MRQIAATRRCNRCCNKSPRVTFENHCHCYRILSLRSIARIQASMNSCYIPQRQNKRKQPCRSVCMHLRQVAATKFKSIRMREHQLVSRHVKFWTSVNYISSLPKLIACTEQVSYLSDLFQHQCRRRDLSPRCMCRSDLSHRVSRP